MNRRYRKLVYETWSTAVDIETAIARNDYYVSYYLDDTTIGRVDEYSPDAGLVTVSYYLVEGPRQELLAWHFARYPGVCCEFLTPPVSVDATQTRVESCQYESPTTLNARYNLYFDQRGRVARCVQLDHEGNTLTDEYNIVSQEGRLIRTLVYDAEGKLLHDYRY